MKDIWRTNGSAFNAVLKKSSCCRMLSGCGWATGSIIQVDRSTEEPFINHCGYTQTEETTWLRRKRLKTIAGPNRREKKNRIRNKFPDKIGSDIAPAYHFYLQDSRCMLGFSLLFLYVSMIFFGFNICEFFLFFAFVCKEKYKAPALLCVNINWYTFLLLLFYFFIAWNFLVVIYFSIGFTFVHFWYWYLDICFISTGLLS